MRRFTFLVERFRGGDRERRSRMSGEGPSNEMPHAASGARSRDPRGTVSGPWSGALSGFLMVLGVALLIVAAVVAITSWRGRASAPIDDQLPFLVGAEAEDTGAAQLGEPGDAAASGEDASRDQAQSATSEGAAEVRPPDLPDTVATQALGQPGGETEAVLSVESVVVYVSGAVASPGVVELDGGARVHQAVEAVGGPTGRADLERVNLAALLVDGERIHVPEIGDDEPPSIVAPSRVNTIVPESGAVSAEPVLIDINRASLAELEELPGVGPSIARAILDLRTARGDYATVDELLLVGGIGPTKLEALRPHAFVTGG